MPTFSYPTQAELIQVAQDKLPRLTQDRLGFTIMPMVDTDAPTLRWEQKDNNTGLQAVRGINADFTRVKKLGGKVYQMEPGVYGEFERIDEVELTTRRQWGTWNGAVSIDDLVMDAQDHLLGRRLDRIEKIIWDLCSTGTFSVAGPMGTTLHTDTFSLATFTAVPAWATAATSTPLANFRAVQLLSRGRSVDFGSGAMAIMNRTTFNSMLANTNANDLAGRRTAGLSTVLSPEGINMILAGEGLPAIVVYDEGYIDESNNFQLFVPNNKVVVVGKKPGGQTVGEYRMTRNANNPDLAPGAFMEVIEAHIPPRSIDVFDGHNGGPVIYYPGAIVVMTV